MAGVDPEEGDGTHMVEIKDKKLLSLREEISQTGHRDQEHDVKGLVFFRYS